MLLVGSTPLENFLDIKHVATVGEVYIIKLILERQDQHLVRVVTSGVKIVILC